MALYRTLFATYVKSYPSIAASCSPVFEKTALVSRCIDPVARIRVLTDNCLTDCCPRHTICQALLQCYMCCNDEARQTLSTRRVRRTSTDYKVSVLNQISLYLLVSKVSSMVV